MMSDEEIVRRLKEDPRSIVEEGGEQIVGTADGPDFDDFEWSYEKAFPVESLFRRVVLSGGRRAFTAPHDAAKWYAGERNESENPSYYDWLEGAVVEEGVRDPLSVADLGDGRLDLLDGWHRLALAIKHDLKFVPAYVGRLRSRANPADSLDPLLVADIECLDGRAPGGRDLWRKRVSDSEIMAQIETLGLPDGWVAFLAELVRQDALPTDQEKLRKAGFRRVGRTARGFSADGLQVQVEGWGESCLEDGLHEGEIPGSGDGRLQAYIDEQTTRKRTLPGDDVDAVPPGARRWLLSLWLPAAPEPNQNHEVVSVDLWEGTL